MVERSLSTFVQPCCMSQLLWRPGRVSDFGPNGLGSKLDIGDKHISSVTDIYSGPPEEYCFKSEGRIHSLIKG